ncbi:MAG: FAD-binding oxidoreductase [Kofleriaceae bacterium]|nr:FAD-binding oxidoreductase [Myxococcales bacterium]MCB9559697.1 FAD-binding oxidoreductase [Kofleriaceae bacterium]
MTAALPSGFLDELRRLGDDRISVDPADLATYGRDWTKVYAPAPAAVAWPRSTDEVAAILRACDAAGVRVVPSGGRTGLAGGAVARDGELVLSLERMRRIDPVDVVGATVRVQAGAITAEVHERCAAHGLTWPVDFASKGSSQIGGNIATNAGGVKVIRYGLTRQWVLGLQVVLIDGTVLELGGALEKNNTGVDLRQLFIGSEGTLGVITEATLKLAPRPRRLDVMVFAVDGLAGVLRLFRDVRHSELTLAAFEFFTQRSLDRLLRHRALRSPFDQPSDAYVLVEVEDAEREDVEAWVASVFERDLAIDGVLAQSATQAAELWQLREGISESLSATGMPHKNDIALPVAALEAFCAELDAVFAARYPGWEICLFGHIGDGNLHVNWMKPDDMSKDEFLARVHDADRDMFELVKTHRGSVSAEHGIGLLKREWLGYSRSPDEIAMMRAIKAALDPRGLLNPGKVLG